MVLAQTRRALPRFENDLAPAMPDVAGIPAIPRSDVASFDRIPEPSLYEISPVGQIAGTDAGAGASPAGRSGEAHSVLVVRAADVPARPSHLPQVDSVRRRLNLAHLRVVALERRSFHSAHHALYVRSRCGCGAWLVSVAAVRPFSTTQGRRGSPMARVDLSTGSAIQDDRILCESGRWRDLHDSNGDGGSRCASGVGGGPVGSRAGPRRRTTASSRRTRPSRSGTTGWRIWVWRRVWPFRGGRVRIWCQAHAGDLCARRVLLSRGVRGGIADGAIV